MIKAFTLFFSLILSMFIGVLQVQNKGLITAKLNANLDGLLSLDASAKAVYEGRAKYIKFIKTRPLEEVTFKSAFYVLKNSGLKYKTWSVFFDGLFDKTMTVN